VDAERVGRVAAPCALGVFVAGLALGPMAESDLFFRVRAGQEILTRHALPGRNLYSFTYPDHSDLDTSWLFEVGAAALHAHGGFAAVVVAKTVVLVATFLAAFVVCRRRGAGPAAAALALAAASWVARERFVERPHIFSLAGCVLVLAVIDALDAPLARRRAAIACVVGVAMWANLHAGVFLAPALLALAAAGAWLDDARALARRLAALAACAALATLATPVGLGLVTYLRLHTVIPTLHPVDEFRAATWVSDAPWLVFAGVVAGVAAVARPRRWRWLLPVAATGVLALRSIRFGADFAVLAAPGLAVGVTALGARLASRAPGLRVAGLVGVVALLVGVAAGPRLAAARAGRPAFDVSLDARALPLDALRFVEDNGLRARMYNDFEVGSYLLFEGYPRYRVFVDPRLPAYPAELHALLGRFDLTRDEWGAALARYGVESALLAYAGLNRRVAWFDPARWALVYRAQDARVFVRRLPQFDALIAAREIPATFSFTVESGTTTLPLTERPAGSPVTACEWQRRLGDLLFELDGEVSARVRDAYTRALAAPGACMEPEDERHLAGWMGSVELAAGHAAAALPLLERALARGDGETSTRVSRAIALEELGRTTDAAVAWTDVAARAPGTPIAAKATARAAKLLRAP
jgi:hypothetical protein